MTKTKTTKADGIKVRCSFTKIMDVTLLKPHPKNPNRHNQLQIDIYGKILQHQGWRRPIVVSERSGFVVRGHGAIAAVKALGLKMAPVELQHYPDEQTEYNDMVADNQLAKLSTLDIDQVAKELAAYGDKFDAELAGFPSEIFARIVEKMDADTSAPTSFQVVNPADIVTEHKCPKCGYEWKGKAV